MMLNSKAYNHVVIASPSTPLRTGQAKQSHPCEVQSIVFTTKGLPRRFAPRNDTATRGFCSKALIILISTFLLSCTPNEFTLDPDSLRPKQIKQFIEEQKERLQEDEEDVQAHYFLAAAYLKQERYLEARKHAQRLTQLSPLVGRYFELSGDIAFKRERYGVALNALKSAIRVQPDLISAYLKLSLVYEKIGESERAISTLEEALQRDPRYEEALYHLARLHLHRWEHDNALQAIKELLTLEPNNQEALLLQVRIYRARGSYYHAKILIGKLLEQAPNLYEAHHELVSVLYHQREWDEALAAIEAFKKDGVIPVHHRIIKARILSDKGQLDQSEELLRKMIDEVPNQTEVLQELAILLIKKGRWDEALRWLSRVLEIDNRLPQAHFLQASLFFKLGNVLQGDLSLNRVLALDPLNPSYQLLAMRRKLMQGQWGTVQQQLDVLLEKDPLNVGALHVQADLYILLGDYNLAETLLRQVQIIRNDDTIRFSLARVLYFREKYRSAYPITKELSETYSGSWESLYLHAATLNRLGRFEEALQHLSPLLQNRIGAGFIHRLAGDLYRYQGKEEEAQKVYEEGLDQFPRQIYLVDALSSSYMVQEKWQQARDLIQGVLEQQSHLETIFLDRLVFIFHKLQDWQQKYNYLQQYHSITDPISTTHSVNSELRLLFSVSPLFQETQILPFESF